MAVTNQTVGSMVPGGINTMPTPINTQPIVFSGNAGNPYSTSTMPGAPSTNPYASTVPGTAPSSATPSNIPTPNIGGAVPGGGDLQGTFGSLTPVIQQLLSSGGGYNQQAINAILAQMQPGIAQGQQNVAEEFGAAGGRFSSAAATGLANYNSQVQLNEGQIMAQMYEQSYQNYMNEVLGISGDVSQYNENKPSGWDIASGILGAGGSILGGALSGGLL